MGENIKRGRGRPKNPNGRMHVVNVRMDNDLHRRVHDAAYRRGVSMGELMRNAIRYYCEFMGD